MKLADTIRRAGRSLRQAKARTLLTSLAIGVGAFTITLALAAGEGGRQYASDIISSNTDVKELYIQPKQDNDRDPSKPQEYVDDTTVSFGGNFTLKTLKQSDIDTIKAIDGVEMISPVYSITPKYVTKQGSKKFLANIDTYSKAIKQDYLAGSTDNLKNNGVLLPDSYREVLGYKTAQDALGTTINVVVASPDLMTQPKSFSLTVVGVIKQSALATITTAALQVDGGVAAEMYQFNNAGTPLEHAYIGATVQAKSEDGVAALKKAIQAKGYEAQTAEDAMSFLFQFINVLMGILIGFGALAVLTSVFGIINTQYISVLERTQQIGLMKALGMRRRDVGRLFKLEAAWIGLLGGVIGAGGAWLAGTLANPWITDKLSLGDSSLLIFQPLSFVYVIGGLMLVAVMAGILPSRKASKLDPIEALRTE